MVGVLPSGRRDGLGHHGVAEARVEQDRVSASVDGDPARLGGFGLRQSYGQHAVGQIRADVVGVDVSGQRGAVGELADVAGAVPQPADLLLLDDLTADAQFAADSLDGQVFAVDTRDLDLDDIRVVGLGDRQPTASIPAPCRTADRCRARRSSAGSSADAAARARAAGPAQESYRRRPGWIEAQAESSCPPSNAAVCAVRLPALGPRPPVTAQRLGRGAGPLRR